LDIKDVDEVRLPFPNRVVAREVVEELSRRYDEGLNFTLETKGGDVSGMAIKYNRPAEEATITARRGDLQRCPLDDVIGIRGGGLSIKGLLHQANFSTTPAVCKKDHGTQLVGMVREPPGKGLTFKLDHRIPANFKVSFSG